MAKLKYWKAVPGEWVTLDAANADTLGGYGYTSFQLVSQKGVANGYAGLDSGGKVPTAQLPATIVNGLRYKGVLDASGGTYPAGPATGDYYVISVAGTIDVEDYQIGDWAVYNGTDWDKLDNTDKVTSVAGKEGNVTLVSADITDATASATGSKIIIRDANGRAQVATPSADADIANKGYVVSAISSKITASGVTYENLLANGDVGSGAEQVAAGNHGHSYNALSDKPTIPTQLSQMSQDSTHRVVTDSEKTTWSAKQGAITVDASAPSSPIADQLWIDTSA